LIPNPATGLRGLLNETMEIINMQPFFGAEGKIRLTLMDLPGTTTPPTSSGEMGAGLPAVGMISPLGIGSAEAIGALVVSDETNLITVHSLASQTIIIPRRRARRRRVL
jgi:tetrahydromethanopterin S-methyltransferase subunit C